MKMSDVFDLPVDYDLVVKNCQADIALNLVGDQAKFAGHAIDCHDGLVEALDWLMHNAKKVLAGQSVRDMDECINRAEIQLRKALEDASR